MGPTITNQQTIWKKNDYESWTSFLTQTNVAQTRYNDLIWFLVFWRHFQQYFSYIIATSFSGGGSRRKPPTMGKQLLNFITCGCESSAPFFAIYKAGCETTRIGDKVVWVVRSNDLTHWATRAPNKIYITVKVIYVCTYKRLKWFVKQHPVHKTKW
jgi:hypothetical protein